MNVHCAHQYIWKLEIKFGTGCLQIDWNYCSTDLMHCQTPLRELEHKQCAVELLNWYQQPLMLTFEVNLLSRWWFVYNLYFSMWFYLCKNYYLIVLYSDSRQYFRTIYHHYYYHCKWLEHNRIVRIEDLFFVLVDFWLEAVLYHSVQMFLNDLIVDHWGSMVHYD